MASAHLRGLAQRERTRELCKLYADGVLDGVIQLGSSHGHCTVKLFPLITHSAYIRRRVESICGQESNSKNDLIIDLFDCPGDLDIVRIVESFCYGFFKEDDISVNVSHVVKLITTCTFLEVDTLASRALKFLEENVLVSWKGCLSVLATFRNSDLKTIEEENLFKKCIAAFLHNIKIELTDSESCVSVVSCNVDCLLRVAQLLPTSVADSIYQSCRAEQFGLCYSKSNQDVDQILCFSEVDSNDPEVEDHIPLCMYIRGDSTIMKENFNIEYDSVVWNEDEGICSLNDEDVGVRWLDGLDFEKRLGLILHLAKTMHSVNDINVPGRIIRLSFRRWDFLCSLLHRATDCLAEMTEASQVAQLRNHLLSKSGAEESSTKQVAEEMIKKKFKEIETEMVKGILDLEMLVSRGLGTVSFWTSDPEEDNLSLAEGKLDWSSKQDARSEVVAKCIGKFNFQTLQSLVACFRKLGSEQLTILSFGKVLDACLAGLLKDSNLEARQALLIYHEFPNDERSSHVGIYHVFENNLSRNTLSLQEVTDLTVLLDYDKLPNEIVEKLFQEVQGDYDPRLLKRFMRIQQVNRIEKERSDKELVKLRSELSGERMDRMNVIRDKQLAERKLVKLTEDKLLVDSQLVQLTDDKLLVQSELVKLTEDKAFAERELEEFRRHLEEEKEKMKCSICFTRPRNVVCLPCTHFLYCFDCLQTHQQKSNTCPVCRGFLTGVLKCHLSN